MRKYINTIGKGIPIAMRLAQQKEQTGTAVWLRFYGFYSLNRGAWHKLKLWWKNGKPKI